MTSADTRGSTLIIQAELLLALLLSALSLLLRLGAREELEGDITWLEGGRTDTPGLPTAAFDSEAERAKSRVDFVNSTLSMGVCSGDICMRIALVITGVFFELPHPIALTYKIGLSFNIGTSLY